MQQLLTVNDQLFSERFDRLGFLVGHGLAGHLLFEPERIVELAASLPSDLIEYNAGYLPVSQDPKLTPGNGLSPRETIRRIRECESWLVLKSVENDPEYRDLLMACLAEVAAIYGGDEPEFLAPRSFVFVSSPSAVTPFHIDPECQFLLQISGRKRIQIFDPADRDVLSAEQIRDHANGGHRNQPFPEMLADRGECFEMGPGDGVHLPMLAPHWVEVMDEVSISFSVTFETHASRDYQERFARL